MHIYACFHSFHPPKKNYLDITIIPIPSAKKIAPNHTQRTSGLHGLHPANHVTVTDVKTRGSQTPRPPRGADPPPWPCVTPWPGQGKCYQTLAIRIIRCIRMLYIVYIYECTYKITYVCFLDYIYISINVFMMFLFRNISLLCFTSFKLQHQNLLYRQYLLHNNLAYTQGSVDFVFVPFSAWSSAGCSSQRRQESRMWLAKLSRMRSSWAS